MKRTAIWVGAVALLGAYGTALAAEEPSAQEKATIFKAAGFKAKGDKYVRCEDDTTMSAQPGSIEMEDLNGDGTAEAWVKESSIFCYGNTAEAFVLVGKDNKDAWVVLLDQVGMPVVQESKSKGWPDIEVGGPGFGKFPVYRYDGEKYALKKK
jgi:hypothetical protein